MAQTLGPPLWATGSWATDAWATDSWATVISAPTVLGDLTTLFAAYVQDERDASLLATLDSTSLVMADYPDVRTEDVTDLNTAYAIRLS
jgi:hypothetical protein